MKNNKTASFLMSAVLAFTFGGCSLLKKEEPKIEINHKIVGKWSSKNISGANLITNFMKDGTASVSMNGKEITNQKYKVIDETTLETETKQGAKYTSKIEFSDNDNTMMVTDFTGIKTPYKRE